MAAPAAATLPRASDGYALRRARESQPMVLTTLLTPARGARNRGPGRARRNGAVPCRLLQQGRRAILSHPHVSGSAADALDPGSNAPVARQVKATFIGDMRISIQ